MIQAQPDVRKIGLEDMYQYKTYLFVLTLSEGLKK